MYRGPMQGGGMMGGPQLMPPRGFGGGDRRPGMGAGPGPDTWMPPMRGGGGFGVAAPGFIPGGPDDPAMGGSGYWGGGGMGPLPNFPPRFAGGGPVRGWGGHRGGEFGNAIPGQLPMPGRASRMPAGPPIARPLPMERYR